MSIAVTYKHDERISKLRGELLLEALKEGRKIDIHAMGISMYPAIKNYDFLTIEPITAQRCRLGDIILVKNDNQCGLNFFIHRLVRIERDRGGCIFYYTKGDRSLGSPEGPFRKENIAGRVAIIKRKHIVIDLNSPPSVYFSRFLAFLSYNFPFLLRVINYFFSSSSENSLFAKILKCVRSQDSLYANTQDLILILSTLNFEARELDAARALIREGIRWNNFCEMAISNGRINCTLKNLKTLSPIIEVPQFVLERLENAHLQAIVKSTKSFDELLRILKEFSDEAICVIPLKGALLSERLYGDISSRGISADIDLLIKEKTSGKSEALIRKIGYRDGPKNEIDAWRWCEDFFKDSFSPLDLHWDVTMMKRSKRRIEGFWQEAKRIEILNNSGEAISYYQWPDEELLIYLCVNLINSKGYRNLRSFFDIDALIRESNSFNWKKLLHIAYEFGVNNSIYAGLLKAKELLGTEVPIFVTNELRPPLTKRLLINMFLNRRVILGNCIRRKFLEAFLSYTLFELLETNSFEDYLKIAKRVFFPPPEALLISCPNILRQKASKKSSNWQYAICLLKRFLRAFNKIILLFLK